MAKFQDESTDGDAYQQSLAMLRRCLTSTGYVAAPVEMDGAAVVWARDGVIAGLAGLASGDMDLINGMERTLDTLAAHQGPHGEIPVSVSDGGKHASYGQLAGSVDSLLWYVLGICAHYGVTKRPSRQVRYWLSVEKALDLAACWEYNNRGFVYTPLAGDWAEEYVQQGYVLSNQLLYLSALRGAGSVFNNKAWQKKAAQLQGDLAINYWPEKPLLDDVRVYHRHAYRAQCEQDETRYWLSAFSPAGYATRFDALAHALALLTNLGSAEQRRSADVSVQALSQQTASPLLPAFWPVIQPGEPLWSVLEANRLSDEMRNQPYLYHNAGLWPMLTALYALGLVASGLYEQERGELLLAAINAANVQGEGEKHWGFAQYLHGQTQQPVWTQHTVVSAAAGVLAHQAVRQQVTLWPLAL